MLLTLQAPLLEFLFVSLLTLSAAQYLTLQVPLSGDAASQSAASFPRPPATHRLGSPDVPTWFLSTSRQSRCLRASYIFNQLFLQIYCIYSYIDNRFIKPKYGPLFIFITCFFSSISEGMVKLVGLDIFMA